MTQLPFEILGLIFELLSQKDLKQCQLTSELWYQVSSRLLYTKVRLTTSRQVSSYIDAVTKSPKLGSYLNVIHIVSEFGVTNRKTIWDEQDLFGTISKYCPNLREMDGGAFHSNFWTRLIFASNQGQFPHLQRLPSLDKVDAELYLYSALSFK